MNKTLLLFMGCADRVEGGERVWGGLYGEMKE